MATRFLGKVERPYIDTDRSMFARCPLGRQERFRAIMRCYMRRVHAVLAGCYMASRLEEEAFPRYPVCTCPGGAAPLQHACNLRLSVLLDALFDDPRQTFRDIVALAYLSAQSGGPGGVADALLDGSVLPITRITGTEWLYERDPEPLTAPALACERGAPLRHLVSRVLACRRDSRIVLQWSVARDMTHVTKPADGWAPICEHVSHYCTARRDPLCVTVEVGADWVEDIHMRGPARLQSGPVLRHPASLYIVRSHVSQSDFGTFVSALEGASVPLTKDNMGGLSRLCEEFQFGELAERLSQFRESDDFKEDVAITGENDRILIQFPEIKHLDGLFDDAFKFTADGAMFECNVAQATALSSAVSEQLSVDACA
jgi:hypothetical protein